MNSAAKGRTREHACERDFAKLGMWARRAGGSKGTDVIAWCIAPAFVIECGGSNKRIAACVRRLLQQHPTSIPLVRLTIAGRVRWSCCSRHKFKRLSECIEQAKSEAA